MEGGEEVSPDVSSEVGVDKIVAGPRSRERRTAAAVKLKESSWEEEVEAQAGLEAPFAVQDLHRMRQLGLLFSFFSGQNVLTKNCLPVMGSRD